MGSTVVYSEAVILSPSRVLDWAEGVVFVLLLIVPSLSVRVLWKTHVFVDCTLKVSPPSRFGQNPLSDL